ncbi:hypothetical protein [Actinophytocola oryzae]|uniref:Tail protein P2 I n=1 Tax=Actinophytocola oryzae TaxID=502181 RepID=A0A4R7VHF5_9PSEU|nr:hypothetical protein [Actinophytocola oryzae]TDV48770.1 hypothetical protein CLV71_108130 [Actinophytocola oryzae]
MTTDNPMYDLLPQYVRTRDAELGHPLRSLLAPMADEYRRVREDVDRLYGDWFVETCRAEVLPLLLDLTGGRTATGTPSRAQVANSVRTGRIKGTADGLRAMATDVTGWPADVVEYFARLRVTQHVDNVRPGNLATADLRNTAALTRLGTTHDEVARSADVRAMTGGVGRHNVPNIAVHLWRLDSYPYRGVHARAVDAAQGRWTFDPAGRDMPLFTPAARPLTRLDLDAALAAGDTPTMPSVVVDGSPATVYVADLSTWDRPWLGRVAVDPELGRLTVARGGVPRSVEVSYHAGAAGDVGAHSYDRARTLAAALAAAAVPGPSTADWQAVVRYGTGPYPSLAAAAAAWHALPAAPGRLGVIVVADSATYRGDVELRLRPGERLLVVAGAVTSTGVVVPVGVRPHLVGGLHVLAQAVRAPVPTGLVLDGLSVEGDVLTGDGLDTLVVSNCTVLGGLGGDTTARCTSWLLRSVVESVGLPGQRVVARDSAVYGRAVAADDLELVACTVLGDVAARRFSALDSILTGTLTAGEVPRVRHSHLRSDTGEPVFDSVDPAHPAFCRLAPGCPPEVTTGAGDNGELGVHNHLGHGGRLAELAFQLDGHLRPGTVAGTCFAT